MTDKVFQSPAPGGCKHCIYRGYKPATSVAGMRNTFHSRALKAKGYTHYAEPACDHPANFNGASPHDLRPESFWAVDGKMAHCINEGWFTAEQWSEEKPHIVTPRDAEVDEIMSTPPDPDAFKF